MTPLQQRFLDAIERNQYTSYINKTSYNPPTITDTYMASAACEKIAEEFAKEFAEWCAEKYIWMNGNKISRKWMKKGSYSTESFTPSQLIQQFKEQGK